MAYNNVIKCICMASLRINEVSMRSMSPPQERTVLVSGSSFLSIDRGITVDSRKNETPGSQIDL